MSFWPFDNLNYYSEEDIWSAVVHHQENDPISGPMYIAGVPLLSESRDEMFSVAVPPVLSIDHLQPPPVGDIYGCSKTTDDKGAEKEDVPVAPENNNINDYAEEASEDRNRHAGSGEALRKLDHNAKERTRRMKLSGWFLVLCSLLPKNPKRSKEKKRWSAPVIIDRVLGYIPELENDIKQLQLKRDNLQLVLHQYSSSNYSTTRSNKSFVDDQLPRVSVHEVKQGEIVVQICMGLEEKQNGKGAAPAAVIMSKLIENAEAEWPEITVAISGAATIRMSRSIFCYNLHFHFHPHPQMDCSLGAHFLGAIKEKVTSWSVNNNETGYIN